MSAAARCSARRVADSCSGVIDGSSVPFAAVGGDHVVDPRAAPGEQRDRRPGAELGVVGVADHDEHPLERFNELVSLQGAHARPCYPSADIPKPRAFRPSSG